MRIGIVFVVLAACGVPSPAASDAGSPTDAATGADVSGDGATDSAVRAAGDSAGAADGTLADATRAPLPAGWPPAPVASQPFAKVHTYLSARGWDGSTEDLAIHPSGSHAVLGVPGHLLRVEPSGDVTELTTTGAALDGPLGLWFDPAGVLWVADAKAKAVKTVSPAGVVAVAFATNGKGALIQPNDLLVDGQGFVWLTDPCLGELVRWDPKTQKAEVLATFDLKTQGGPNGVALAPSGSHVVVTTENPGLLCALGGIPIDKKLGSVWRAALGTTPLQFQALAEGLGVFGDGCTFDAAGHLYATIDAFTLAGGITLEHSRVYGWALGAGAPVALVESKSVLYANVVFGHGAFAPGQMVLALLTVPPFTPDEARGLHALGWPPK